jgi:PTS system fructose-specific IIA component/PTS system nitrogen regulatory IIA component
MKLYNFLKPELIRINCQESNTEDLLREMVHLLKRENAISNENLILKKLVEREKLGSTSIGNNSAVPHTKVKEIKKDPVISIYVSKTGIMYHESDNEPVHLIILILSPNHSPIIHLQILAAAASLIKKSDHLIKEIISSKTPEELISIIKKYEGSDD